MKKQRNNWIHSHRRAVVLTLLGVSFVLIGLLLDQEQSIMRKAVFLCLQCIGIG